MTYKEFKRVCDLMKKSQLQDDKYYNLGIDLQEVTTPLRMIIDIYICSILTDDGSDWFGWFMYEKGYVYGKMRNDLKGYDGKKEICKDLRGLYDYLNENKYFKC